MIKSLFVYHILATVIRLFPIRLRARFWLYLRQLGQRRWKAHINVQRVSGGMYVKLNSSALHRLSEGEATRFVGKHTNVPVPVVIDNFEYEGHTFLITSRLPGHSLLSVYKRIPPEVELKLSAQLSQILASLRALSAPANAVCGFDGGPVYCYRISLHAAPAGPWPSIAEFHEDLMRRTKGLTYNVPEGQSEAICDTIRRAHSRPHRLCLTHNDLGPHNILVDDDYNITGIVDWEACAWMPEYWELTKSTSMPRFSIGRWPRIMTAAFPMYALEQEAEELILQHRESYF
ncbi:kinase-like protein [Fomes fomentarius]|nr:kinase-like protein [Fomes fomentarius]